MTTPKGRRPMPKFNLGTYLEALSVSLKDTDAEIAKIVQIIKDVRTEKRRLWILGNGGSLAIGQHFAQDLIKMCGVRAHAMTCPSMITAYTNDESFEESFNAPLSVLREHGDAILIFSCSGNSRNYGRVLGIGSPIISIVGSDGGFLKKHSEVCVHVKNQNYQICETAFCVVADLVIAELLED